MKKIVFVLCLFLGSNVFAQSLYPPYLFESNNWIDSVFEQLTQEQKIAQLLMLELERKNEDLSLTVEEVKKFQPGGLIFFKNSASKTASNIHLLQSNSKLPMLTAIDGEWGLSMRLSNTLKFPVAMALGAIKNDSLIYEMGKEIAYQAKSVGINYNLAPDVDVNNNSENPVINYRSFGENPIKVAKKGTLYMQGMQAGNILCSAKHFPGHGDTDMDSHLSLPTIPHSYERLTKIELYPFNELIVNGVTSIMTGHLYVPSLDSVENRSATLSPNIIKGLLRDTMGFKGLVITDALNMKGVAAYYKPGEVEVMALKAGADILLMPDNPAVAISAIKQAIVNGELNQKDIDEKCKKILQAKYWLGLNSFQPNDLSNLSKKLFRPEAKVLQQKLFKESITVIRNQDSILPIKDLEKQKYVALALGRSSNVHFHAMLNKYKKHKTFYLPKKSTESQILALEKQLEKEQNVIVSLHKLWLVAKNNYGLSENEKKIFKYLADNNKNVIFVLFGNPYTLKEFDSWKKFNSVIISYQENNLTQSFAAQLIYGAINANGELPVSIDEEYQSGRGIQVKAIGRLKYGVPEDVGMNSLDLHQKVDSIAYLGIEKGAFPGCQVLIAKNNEVIFHETYGFLTYDSLHQVNTNNVYDLASVTKITASLPALMRLNSENKIHLSDKMSDYYKNWQSTNKKNILFIDALTHQAQLWPWIPFYKNAKPFGLFRQRVFSSTESKKYSLHVAQGIFENKNYPKHIYKQIAKSPLLEKKEYKYSDLSFYIYPKIVENIEKQNFESYLKQNFYEALGMDETAFNAYKIFPQSRIVPTEKDTFFRMQLLRGYVHDEGASMLDGISGHAGLFSTANDLAKLMQMYVQLGEYAGKSYISKSVFQTFTKRPFVELGNRRAIGFDKSYFDNAERELVNAYPAPSCSENSFGHGGFTGTFVWADPDNQLVFIFLSNRVYPTRENRKIYQLNIRTAMHQAIYDAIEE